MSDIQKQHQELCNTANNLLKQWYVETTGKDPVNKEFFYFDYHTELAGIFQWPMRKRDYCRIVLFRQDINQPEGYLREIFNLAHELGHFTDYKKNGRTFDSARKENKLWCFYGEAIANLNGIKFVKGLKQKILFSGFAFLSLVSLADNYFCGSIFSKVVRKVYIDWYIWKVMAKIEARREI